MDHDLETLSREELVREVMRLRAGIRAHRDSSGHDLCWHHPQLWGTASCRTTSRGRRARIDACLMCDDVEAFIADMKKHNVACGPAQNQGWGVRTQLMMPGGGKLGVYQPRHARPKGVATGV